MAVEGKTILQTTERTELTGKEGIPFQEGTQNGHVLVERLKEYVGEGLVKEDGLKTINGEKLTGIGDITFESDAGKPVILRYPKYNETSDDSTILEKANSGEWFCTLPQMLENYNGRNLKAPFIGVQDDTNENFSPVTCYRIYSASNYYFMLYFLESNNNMEIQFRGFRMKYDPQDLTKWTGVFDNGTVRLSLASASNDGLMSKEDKAKVDGIRFSEDENSVLFNGKKYGVHVFKNLQRLSTSSSSDDVKKALNIDSPQDLESLISKGLNFVSVDTESTDKNLCPCSVRYAAPNIISITYCSAYSSNILTVHISVLSGSSSSFRVDGIEDPINSIPSVNNTLTSTSASEALSASMGKKLQDEKLAKEDVVDNLTTNEASKALSAAQGKALNDKFNGNKININFSATSNSIDNATIKGYMGNIDGTTLVRKLTYGANLVDSSSDDWVITLQEVSATKVSFTGIRFAGFNLYSKNISVTISGSNYTNMTVAQGRRFVPAINNTLTSTSTSEALSAAQGKALNDRISGLGNVYRVKGTKTNLSDVLALTNAKVGDVWNVTNAFTLGGKPYPANTNVVCITATSSSDHDEGNWDPLGGTVDLSTYVPKSDIVDNLSTSDSKKPLSAKQGLALATMITELEDNKETYQLLKTLESGTLSTQSGIDAILGPYSSFNAALNAGKVIHGVYKDSINRMNTVAFSAFNDTTNSRVRMFAILGNSTLLYIQATYSGTNWTSATTSEESFSASITIE